jgi:hypothetical protein
MLLDCNENNKVFYITIYGSMLREFRGYDKKTALGEIPGQQNLEYL